MQEDKRDTGAPLGGAVLSSQLAQTLAEEIRSGSFAHAARLPAEVELAARMGVSRTVVRDALGELERAGFVERVRGIGTVIHRNVVHLPNRLDQKVEFLSMIAAAGHTPHTDHVRVDILPADEPLARLLEIEPGAQTVRVYKRVLADAKPVIFCIDYFPLSIFRGTSPLLLDMTEPVFDMLKRECGQVVTSTTTRVQAAYGDPAMRRLMELSSGEALLLLDEVSYTRLCLPVMRSLGYYTNFFDFSILRKKF